MAASLGGGTDLRWAGAPSPPRPGIGTIEHIQRSHDQGQLDQPYDKKVGSQRWRSKILLPLISSAFLFKQALILQRRVPKLLRNAHDAFGKRSLRLF